jgi:hypothetical protein
MQTRFAFGGSHELTHEEIQQQRRMAEQLMGQLGTPARNVGEGLAALGRGLLVRGINKRTAAADTANKSEHADLFRQLISRQMGSSFDTASPAAQTPPSAQGGISPPNPPVARSALPAVQETQGEAGGGEDFYTRINASLARTESGGDYGVVNSEGFTGKYQFGQPRLDDFNRVNGTSYTTAQLRENPQLQEQVQNWHVKDITDHIRSNGLDQYIGQDVNGDGVPESLGGMVAMAHLGGTAGMQRFLESGGRYNPADSNGTSLADYARTHAMDPAQPQAPETAMAFAPEQGGAREYGQGPQVNDIVQLLDNPYTSDGQRMVLSQLLERQFAQPERMTPYQRAQLGLAQSADRRAEMQFQRDMQPEPGYTLISPQEAAQMGLPDGAWQRGPDGKVYQIGGGGTNVTVNNNAGEGAQIGTVPQGFAAVADPTNPSGYRLEAIPGGEPAAERAQAERQREGQQSAREDTANLQIEEIGRAIDLIEGSRLPTTGLVGGALSGVGGTGARDLSGILDTVRANVGFDYLNAMRQNSPTGGALGQVTERELAMLQATAGNLEQSQSEEQLLFNLRRLERQMLEVIHGPDYAAPAEPQQVAPSTDDDELFRKYGLN